MAQRTTLTLQDDVYDALVDASRRTGRRLRDVVNETLRRGLQAAPGEGDESLELRTFSSEVLFDSTSTSAALEHLEGPEHR